MKSKFAAGDPCWIILSYVGSPSGRQVLTEGRIVDVGPDLHNVQFKGIDESQHEMMIRKKFIMNKEEAIAYKLHEK